MSTTRGTVRLQGNSADPEVGTMVPPLALWNYVHQTGKCPHCEKKKMYRENQSGAGYDLVCFHCSFRIVLDNENACVMDGNNGKVEG
jgi:hypothetical protein